MNATYTPSVLLHHHTPLQDSPPSLDGYGSTFPASEGSNSPGRRQRISMACQYCRHRKIRCCGGAPCRNCSRAKRVCEYAAVPDEVNRATREKKAIAKATKASQYTSPITTRTPYFVDTPVYDVNYVGHAYPQPHAAAMPHTPHTPQRPAHLGHRRTVSMPGSAVGPWVEAPPAPALHSPPMFESPTWMYTAWNSSPSVPAPAPQYEQQQHPQAVYHPFPSVLEHTAAHQVYLQGGAQQNSIALDSPAAPATPADSRSSSTESDLAAQQHILPTSWSTSHLPTQTYLRPPVQLTPSLSKSSAVRTASSPPTPSSIYQSPFPTPPLFQHPMSSMSSMQHTPPQPMYYASSPLVHSASSSNSPTLAPEMQLPPKDSLVGLGIGVPESVEFFRTPTMTSDEYFAAPPLHF